MKKGSVLMSLGVLFMLLGFFTLVVGASCATTGTARAEQKCSCDKDSTWESEECHETCDDRCSFFRGSQWDRKSRKCVDVCNLEETGMRWSHFDGKCVILCRGGTFRGLNAKGALICDCPSGQYFDEFYNECVVDSIPQTSMVGPAPSAVTRVEFNATAREVQAEREAVAGEVRAEYEATAREVQAEREAVAGEVRAEYEATAREVRAEYEAVLGADGTAKTEYKATFGERDSSKFSEAVEAQAAIRIAREQRKAAEAEVRELKKATKAAEAEVRALNRAITAAEVQERRARMAAEAQARAEKMAAEVQSRAEKMAAEAEGRIAKAKAEAEGRKAKAKAEAKARAAKRAVEAEERALNRALEASARALEARDRAFKALCKAKKGEWNDRLKRCSTDAIPLID